jgi:hypothetical protein
MNHCFRILKKVFKSIQISTILIGLIYTNIFFHFTTNAQYSFEHIGTEKGLSQSTGFSICKYDGFIWFGTQDGLNRYDGYNTKVYKIDEYKNLKNNYILALFVDQEKN